jgi:hypothetical protein
MDLPRADLSDPPPSMVGDFRLRTREMRRSMVEKTVA